MNFSTKDKLTEKDIQKGLKFVIKDGLATQAMITLTSGVFLVAFALQMGASNIIIGLLAAIPPLSQLIQIPAVYLIEKFRVRKAICVYTTGMSRFFWLFIALTPFFFSSRLGLIILLIALFMNTILAAISNCSWNSWMRDLIPERQLGRFFSKRMGLSLLIGMILSLSAALFIDLWKKHFDAIYGYSILFLLAFLAGMAGVYFISKIPEPRMMGRESGKFLSMLSQPFKDFNFKNLLIFSGSWNFAINLAAPFFTVYMLKMLQLDISLIIALGILSQLTNLTFLRIWGKISDNHSNKSVLSVSSPLFLLCILAWTFTTMPEKHVLTLPLLIAIHFFMGISLAGVNLASRNISLKLAPRQQATPYLAAHSIINSLAAGIAPIIGGGLADYLVGRELNWKIIYKGPDGGFDFPILSFQQWDFFFFFAFIIGLYSLHRLAMIKEEGDVEKRVVINTFFSELKRPIRNFSTAGGLSYMNQFPSLIKNLRRRKRNLVSSLSLHHEK